MDQRPSRRTMPISRAALCALLLGAGLVKSGGWASAQAAGGVSLTGYVSPRCWIASGAAPAELGAPALPGAAAVRCSDQSLQVRMEQGERLQVRRESSAGGARTVTVSPRS